MRRWIRPWLAIAGTLIAVALLAENVFHIPLVWSARSLIAEPGWPAALAVVVLLIADMLLPVPSSLVMTLSGVVFGALWGGVFSVVGCLLGNIAGFALARRYGLRFAKRARGVSMGNRMDTFDRYGALAIIVSRPIPVLTETMSIMAGLAGMKPRRYLGALALGTVPTCFAFSLAGAFSMQTRSLLPAVLVGVLIPAAGWIFWKSRLDRPPAAAVRPVLANEPACEKVLAPAHRTAT